MDFFEAQASAKRRTSRLMLLFILAVIGVIAACYLAALIVVARIRPMPGTWLVWDGSLFGGVSLVVCLITGLVLVNSGVWMREATDGAILTKAAFDSLPVIGPAILTVGLLTFVFSTILGWSYYGEKAVEYLFGKAVVRPYRCLWTAAVMVGSVLSLPIVWSLADVANALMAVPNLISLLALSGVIVAETRQHLWENSGSGEDRV